MTPVDNPNMWLAPQKAKQGGKLYQSNIMTLPSDIASAPTRFPISPVSPIDMEKAFEKQIADRKTSTKVLTGRKTQYAADGKQIVDEVIISYNDESGQVDEPITMMMEAPIIPKYYRNSFYSEILNIRHELGEDQVMVEKIKPYLYYERALSVYK